MTDTVTEGLNLPVPHEGDNFATLLDSITCPPARPLEAIT